MNFDYIENDGKRKSNKVLYVLIFLFFIFVLGFFLYLFKDNISNLFSKNNNPTDTPTTPVGESDESQFSKLVSTNGDVITYTPEAMSNLNSAQFFYTGLKSFSDNDWESILEVNQSLVEVIFSGDSTKSYKLIYSKNPSLDYEIGENINFRPKVLKSDSLVVMSGSVVNFALDQESVDKFEESVIDTGDRFVFTCQSEDCSDGILDWVFVLKK